MGSGLVGLSIKGVLAGESFTVSRLDGRVARRKPGFPGPWVPHRVGLQLCRRQLLAAKVSHGT